MDLSLFLIWGEAVILSILRWNKVRNCTKIKFNASTNINQYNSVLVFFVYFFSLLHIHKLTNLQKIQKTVHNLEERKTVCQERGIKAKKNFLRHLPHCNHTIPVEQSIFLVQQTLLLTLTLCSTNVCTTLSKPASQAKWRGDIPSQASIPPSPSGPGRRGLENVKSLRLAKTWCKELIITTYTSFFFNFKIIFLPRNIY